MLRKIVHNSRSISPLFGVTFLTFADNRENHERADKTEARVMNKTPKFCISNLFLVKGLCDFARNFCPPFLSSLRHQHGSLEFVSARYHGWPARIRTWEYWNQNPEGRVFLTESNLALSNLNRKLSYDFQVFDNVSLRALAYAWVRFVVIALSSEWEGLAAEAGKLISGSLRVTLIGPA